MRRLTLFCVAAAGAVVSVALLTGYVSLRPGLDSSDPIIRGFLETGKKEGWSWLRKEERIWSLGPVQLYDYGAGKWQDLFRIPGESGAYNYLFSYCPAKRLLAFYDVWWDAGDGGLSKFGGFSGKLCVVELDTGITDVVRNQTGAPSSFSPDGRTLAFYDSSSYKELLAYDLTTRTVRKLADVRYWTGMDEGLLEGIGRSSMRITTSPVFSPDSRCIYYVGPDSAAYKLDLESGEKETLFPAHLVVGIRGDAVLFVRNHRLFVAEKQESEWVTRCLHPPTKNLWDPPHIYESCFATPGGEFVICDEWFGPHKSDIGWRIFEVATAKSVLIRDHALFGQWSGFCAPAGVKGD